MIMKVLFVDGELINVMFFKVTQSTKPNNIKRFLIVMMVALNFPRLFTTIGAYFRTFNNSELDRIPKHDSSHILDRGIYFSSILSSLKNMLLVAFPSNEVLSFPKLSTGSIKKSLTFSLILLSFLSILLSVFVKPSTTSLIAALSVFSVVLSVIFSRVKHKSPTVNLMSLCHTLRTI